MHLRKGENIIQRRPVFAARRTETRFAAQFLHDACSVLVLPSIRSCYRFYCNSMGVLLTRSSLLAHLSVAAMFASYALLEWHCSL